VNEPAGRPAPCAPHKRDARIAWLSGPSVRLHAVMSLGVALCAAATWLEWTRAIAGHEIAWVYTFEWPLFAVMGIFLWWRLLHADLPGRDLTERTPREKAHEMAAAQDPDLIAWQQYLDRLHAADPPGGPPQDRRA